MLGPRAEPPRFEVARSRPGLDLAELVEHYWTVRWDLRGRAPTPSTPFPTRRCTWSPSGAARGSWGC